jgi:hypothetical protein
MNRVGQNLIDTVYIYGIFGREITKHTIIYTVLANPRHKTYTGPASTLDPLMHVSELQVEHQDVRVLVLLYACV